MVFLYHFPLHTTIILFQVAKKVGKKNGEMVLYFYFAFNRQAVHIEAENQENCDLQDYLLRVKLNIFVGFVECNKSLLNVLL